MMQSKVEELTQEIQRFTNVRDGTLLCYSKSPFDTSLLPLNEPQPMFQ